VYGVEFLEKIVKGFFEDNSLPYDIAHVENVGKVYKVRRKWNIYILEISEYFEEGILHNSTRNQIIPCV